MKYPKRALKTTEISTSGSEEEVDTRTYAEVTAYTSGRTRYPPKDPRKDPYNPLRDVKVHLDRLAHPELTRGGHLPQWRGDQDYNPQQPNLQRRGNERAVQRRLLTLKPGNLTPY